ncbi:MAG: hypothetical protein M9887_02275 [Chitinophagales bacterium]|nr:hypothetical protein [Chitinophagales bacterium]
MKKSVDTLSTTQENKDISDENLELAFQSSLNLELEELLEKNTKRFFGGCGG